MRIACPAFYYESPGQQPRIRPAYMLENLLEICIEEWTVTERKIWLRIFKRKCINPG